MKTWLLALGLAAASVSARASTPAPATVHISNFTFSPAVIEVPIGTSLNWVNDDDVPHTVVGTDRDSPLKSSALDTEDHYAVIMSKPGTYHYFCSLHPHMTGTVIVK
jgi:plastocyanin